MLGYGLEPLRHPAHALVLRDALTGLPVDEWTVIFLNELRQFLIHLQLITHRQYFHLPFVRP